MGSTMHTLMLGTSAMWSNQSVEPTPEEGGGAFGGVGSERRGSPNR